MERRVLEDDELRTIKIKRNAEGGVEDVIDPLAENVEEEDELIIEIPETDEYDEDLVGLTPQQLKAELIRREQAEREAAQKRDELIAEGRARMEESDYDGAEPFFAQALLYDGESEEASRGLWAARTRNFTDDAPFYDEDTALEAAQSNEKTKAFLRERAGERLSAERERLQAEAAPLRERVSAGQNERRGAFEANRSYYFMRFSVFAASALLLLIGGAISASFLVKTTGSLPLICMIACFSLAALFLLGTLVFLRRLVVASRLCSANETLSSTQEGEAWEELEQKIDCLNLILNDDNFSEEE